MLLYDAVPSGTQNVPSGTHNMFLVLWRSNYGLIFFFTDLFIKTVEAAIHCNTSISVWTSIFLNIIDIIVTFSIFYVLCLMVVCQSVCSFLKHLWVLEDSSSALVSFPSTLVAIPKVQKIGMFRRGQYFVPEGTILNGKSWLNTEWVMEYHPTYIIINPIDIRNGLEHYKAYSVCFHVSLKKLAPQF